MTMSTKKLDPKLIDELINDCKSPEDFLGESGIITEGVLEEVKAWQNRSLDVVILKAACVRKV